MPKKLASLDKGVGTTRSYYTSITNLLLLAQQAIRLALRPLPNASQRP